MLAITDEKSRSRLSISSSTLDDVWHADRSPGAYEWWYFDAMSEDGDEAVVIWFLDNSVLSPRYNRALRPGQTTVERFPAILFAYYCDGKVVYRSFSEFAGSEIDADTVSPACRIGESSFRFDSAPYGSGFEVQVQASLSRGRRLDAKFEWLSVEADLGGTSAENVAEHLWNVVATRSDVSGRINILNKRGSSIDVRHFRGTGYHDHEQDARGFADTVSEKSWGRVHFADTTAVYQVFSEVGCEAEARLLVTRDGRLIERTVHVERQNFARDKFGIRYPTRLTLTSDDNIRLRVKPSAILDSSFCSVRFASEMTLTLRDGKPRRSMGISEMIAPRTLKYRWLDWLTDMRIGKNGKRSLL